MNNFLVISLFIIAAILLAVAISSSFKTCGVCGKKVGFGGFRIAKSQAFVCKECFNKACDVNRKNTGIILNAFLTTVEEIKTLCEKE